MEERDAARDVVVVGGGITGLAAALRLRDTLPAGSSVTVVEQSAVAGGKLRAADVAGVEVDQGAETFLCRVPEAMDLARRLGLGDDLVHPATTAASVLVGGNLWPLPGRTLLGVPADPETVAASGVLSASGLEAVRAEAGLPPEPNGGDWSVGELVGRRMGRELVDRLVDPLLGGVYAGHADGLSVRATLPPLAAALSTSGTLTAAAAAVLGPPPDGEPAPVFAGLRGGVARLSAAAAAALTASGGGLLLGRPVRELSSDGAGWRLVVGSTRDPEPLHADAVVLALPARPAGRLLAPAFPVASAEVGAIDYASIAIVTLVLPPTRLPAGSGLLVPASEGHTVKAVTYASQKWPHLAARAGSSVVVRASVGRYGEEAVFQRDDAELIALVRRELGAVLGGLPEPIGARVQRWGGALPQYAVGHLDRVRRARAAVDETAAGTVALAGAAYDGVGIPACIRSGQAAADRVRAALAERGESGHG